MKYPVLFCVLAYALWLVGQNGTAFVYRKLTSIGGNAESVAGEAGAILLILLILCLTGRLQILKEKRIGLGRGLIYGIGLILFAGLAGLSVACTNKQPLNTSYNIFSFTVYMITVGMAEEFLCRGIMTETLEEHYGTEWSGSLKAILISSFIFGLIHFTNLILGASFIGVFGQVLNAFAIGVVFAVIYLRTGNLWVTVVIHAIWDFLILMATGDGLFVSSKTLEEKLSGSFSVMNLLPCAFYLVMAFLIFRTKKAQSGIKEFFNPYCRKLEEERG